MSNNAPSISRRKLLKSGALAAGAAATATVAMPQVSRAQTVTWKYQSTWPTKDIFHEFAVDYAKKVNDMSGGRLKLDVLAAGAVVPAFQMQDAVHSGVLDGGHGVTRLLVRQEQGRLAVRHAALDRLGRAQHARLVLLRRRRGALQRADQRHPEAQPRRLPVLPDADPAARLVQEADQVGRRLQGHEVSHRRPVGRPVQGNGRGGHHPAGRRNRAGDGPRPARRGRVQQPVLRHPARLPRRLQGTSWSAATTSSRNPSRSASTRPSSTRLPAELKSILRYAAFAATADQFAMAHDRYSKDLEEIKKRGVKSSRRPSRCSRRS